MAGWRGAGLSPLLQPAATAVANLCVSLGSWRGEGGLRRDAGDVTRQEWRPAGPHQYKARFRSGR